MAEPRLFVHLTQLYNHLQEDAVGGLYSGSQKQAFDKLGLSPAYNPRLFRALRELGCIETVARGTGRVPTKLRLVKPPQIEEFQEWNAYVHETRPLTSRVSLRTMQSELRQLERRLPQGVDLGGWIIGIEGRLLHIEKRLDDIDKERNGTN